MDTEEFKQRAKQLIEFISEYNDGVGNLDVYPDVYPGFLSDQLPDEAPSTPEEFDVIFNDFKTKFLPGLVHHHHPKFFAYFSPGKSYATILGEMLTAGLSTVVSTWNSNPAGTELETVVLDWFGRAMGIPKSFLTLPSESAGGGVVLSSGSESILISMIAARTKAIQNLKGSSNLHDSFFLPQLVAYCSKDANSCVEKAAKISLVQIRIIDVDKFGRFRADILKSAIEEDSETGLTPFFVLATVGTTVCCAFDDIHAIGQICKKHENIWFHVDGSYGGNAFILPEMRKFSKGLDYADSFNVNASKALLVNIEFAALFVKDMNFLEEALSVNRIYFPQDHKESIDFRHYGISLSRRMRGLKFWFVMRLYGIEGLQRHLRNLMKLANKMQEMMKEDERFTVCNDVTYTTVCFRLKGPDTVNKELMDVCNKSKRMHMIPSVMDGKYCLRLVVMDEYCKDQHIEEVWSDIQMFSRRVLLRRGNGFNLGKTSAIGDNFDPIGENNIQL